MFFVLTAFSSFLLIHNNEFQRSKYLLVFQEIAGRVYFVSNSVQSYLNLKTTNADLMQRIVILEEKIQGYQKQIEYLSDRLPLDSIDVGIDPAIYHYTHARVVHNQVNETDNYILLDKGLKDGITEDMAVVSVKGIVGVVMRVSPHYSRVIPVLNSGYNPSCMIKDKKFFGSLFWDGKDPRYIHLRRLPSHASYAIGDTVVTSGYSATFPAGVLVGVIEDAVKQKNDEYNSVKVRLFTDFSTLSEVLIIRNPLQEEEKNMEKGVSEE